jgi:hypothetical protein
MSLRHENAGVLYFPRGFDIEKRLGDGRGVGQ